MIDPMTGPMTSNSDPTSTRPGALAVGSGQRLRKRWIVTIILGAVVGGALWYASPGGETKRNGADNLSLPATPVVAVPVRQGNLDVYLYALGTVTPLNAVVVRGQVDGQLMSVAFDEGQMVEEGDLLAQIDPEPFEMQIALTAGQLARNQALLENAKADLERFRTLLAQDSISRQQVDTQESLVRQYAAAVQIDQSRLDNAKLKLTHTLVTAPIGGRVGLRQVDPGNIVRTSDANGIVVIVQLQPVGVVFPIPEDALPRVMKRLRAGDSIPVEAYDRAQKEKLGTGRLLAADNQIDTATGTIKLKAEFPNDDSTLFANQFVNVRLIVETRPKAKLVPTAAIQRGSAGTFVYVVKDDQTVAVTPVKVGPMQGEITAIDSGISVGAMVVVDGADRLREGAKVKLVVRDPPPTSARRLEPRSGKKGKERLPGVRNPHARLAPEHSGRRRVA